MYYAVVRSQGKAEWHKAGTTPAAAEELLGTLTAQRAAEDEEGMRLVELAEGWLDDLDNRPGKPGWKIEQQHIVKNVLIPCLGNLPVARIEERDTWELVVGRMEGYAPVRKRSRCSTEGVSLRTALKELSVLSVMLDDARTQGLVLGNAARDVRRDLIRLRKHQPSRPRVVLSQAQVYRLIEKTPPSHRPLIELLAMLGLRLGEALALEIGDYDRDAKLLTIRATWSHATLTAPKSATSNRTLRIADSVDVVIREQIERASATENPLGLLFPGPRGKRMDPGHWRESVFHPAARAASLPSNTVPHSLRHTAAVNMRKAGRRMDEVKSILGHSTIAITMDLYGALAPVEHDEPVDALGG